MTTFRDDFSLFPLGAHPQDVPSGYAIQVLGGGVWTAYVTRSPRRLLVSTARDQTLILTRTGNAVPTSGRLKMKFGSPASGGALLLTIGKSNTDPNFTQIYYWGYGGRIFRNLGAGLVDIGSAMPNTDFTLEIIRDVNLFTLIITNFDTNTVVYNQQFTNPNVAGNLEISMAEMEYLVEYLEGETETDAPEPLTASATETSFTLQCADVANSSYSWEENIAGVWTAISSTAINSILITGLTAPSTREYRVRGRNNSTLIYSAYTESLVVSLVVPLVVPLVTSVWIQGKSLLTGFTLTFEGGHPKRLTGKGKLEDVMYFIAEDVLYREGLLKKTLIQAQLGLLAKSIKDSLEDSESWFIGQPSPVAIGTVSVTLRSDSIVGGVRAIGEGGNLQIGIQYSETNTEIEIPQDEMQTLIIPFGSFSSGEI